MSIFKKRRISVCVFCGAELGNKKLYQDIATETGKIISKNNMRLVYGAGGRGLMGKVANSVLSLKGKIFGITTKVIADFEEPIKGTKYKMVNNIQLRKRGFINYSDAFIALPGGFGTFDEIFDILVGKEIIGKHKKITDRPVCKIKKRDDISPKPLVLIDINGFFKPFEKLVDSLISNGFMPETNKKYFKIVKTPKEAISYIKKYVKK